MRETRGYIERIKRINQHWNQLEVAVDESLSKLRSGQTVLARMGEPSRLVERWDPYLREHWWPVAIASTNKLLIERPASVTYTPGQPLSLLGPVGEPFRFRRSLRNVLLIAYNTPPIPLVMMIPALLKNNVSVNLALLGTAKDYNTLHLPPEIEVVRDEETEMEWDNQVMTFGWADQIFATVGPGDELQRFATILSLIREKRNDVPPNYIFGVFQSIPPCGTGACHACMIKTQDGLKLVCTDGPAFDLTQTRLPG